MTTRSPATQPWLAVSKPKAAATVRLFCFPYAGGSASLFRRWSLTLPAHVEVCPVQLPGRESRFREKPFTRCMPLVEALAEALRPELDKPFAFFGHSMGALLAFELARLLRQLHGLSPVHLFVSGRRAPQTGPDDEQLHSLPDAALLEALGRLKGTPPQILENAELMELLLPMLRADFAVCETYRYTPQPPLSCPITVFGGLHDPKASREHLDAWSGQTSAAFRMRMFAGDHFFLHSVEASLLQALSEELSEELGARDEGRGTRDAGGTWDAAPLAPHPWPLAPDSVHVWRASLDQSDGCVSRLKATLSSEELLRAGRFYFPKDRDHFIVGRGTLRSILARYLDRAPEEFQFAYSPHGKPALASEANGSGLHFNLAHSHGLALIAVTRGREVGVDLERVSQEFAGEPIAERFFSPQEVATLRAVPTSARREAFFHCWTRKEAYLKATGRGLSLPLDAFDVSLAPGQPAALLSHRAEPEAPRRWSLRQLNPAPGYVGAIAAEGTDWRLWCGQWLHKEERGVRHSDHSSLVPRPSPLALD
jgi:medium-chain acyl-[acyl-carrier-protein] hydrolase